MIECTLTENGDLALTVAECDREDLADMLAEYGADAAMAYAMEGYSCNGSFTPFDGGAGNPFVGLTSAPCIAESMTWNDYGQAEIVGGFWYFPDYAVICPVEKLAAGETVIFRRAT